MTSEDMNDDMNDKDMDDYDRVWEIIKECRFAMLTTVSEDGSLRSRPMTTVQKEFTGRLWFFVPTHSETARAIEDNASVCVAYADTDRADFVAISGRATLVSDPAVKARLWQPTVQAWFPQGAESPEISLIKVYGEHAEYWDSNNKLVQLFSMASAHAGGTTPKHMGEHRELKM